jgi:hypothetical protein
MLSSIQVTHGLRLGEGGDFYHKCSYEARMFKFTKKCSYEERQPPLRQTAVIKRYNYNITNKN